MTKGKDRNAGRTATVAGLLVVALLALALPSGALVVLRQLLANVREALLGGLHSIFVMGSILMVLAVAVNFFLPEVPLRKKHHAPVAEA